MGKYTYVKSGQVSDLILPENDTRPALEYRSAGSDPLCNPTVLVLMGAPRGQFIDVPYIRLSE